MPSNKKLEEEEGRGMFGVMALVFPSNRDGDLLS